MQYRILYIDSSNDLLTAENTRISFKKFTEFLEEKAKEGNTLQSKFYRFVLKHFKRHPQLLESVSIADLKNYHHLLSLLEGVVLPHLVNEKDFALALGAPMHPVFFFSTEAFQHLVETRGTDEKNNMKDSGVLMQFRQKRMSYAIILERFYNFQLLANEEIIYTRENRETQLTRYFNLNIDNRFVEVIYKGTLPKINVTQAQQQLANSASLKKLEKVLPLADFSFAGFSIVTSKDITPKYALHKMRSTLIRHDPRGYNETYQTIIELLAQLCDRRQVSFGLLPFLELNERLVSYYGDYTHSIIINISKRLNIPESTFLEWINVYFKDPQMFIKKGYSNESKGSDELYRAFEQSGFNGYALIPVFHNKEVAGMLEVAATNADALDETLFTRIDPAIPILGQLMHRSQTEFTAHINNVIRTNFTAIQPSVTWKFNEAAWDYIKNTDKGPMRKMAEIRFEDVHPLYGAIDIRNSTVERNKALHKDMRYYFILVKNILNDLKTSDKNAVNELTGEADIFLEQAETLFTGNEGFSFGKFIEKVNFYLTEIEATEAHNKNLIRKYFREIDERNGKAYSNRRILENSMQYLNYIMADHLDKMHAELEKQYPVYFEKIRTDGIEYDIYLGQSISPKLSYKRSYLDELRLIQLKNMAVITKLIYISAQSLPVPLQTTQLIYVNAASIDITFRMDEKRFDVEGSYNIRYQVVKKRIDKVHIMHTGERLTQPGKLAIIYTERHHETEYLNYIGALQRQGLIKPNIELLELETLQGVTGLKAIRVEVNLD